jgi:hypothetical protein
MRKPPTPAAGMRQFQGDPRRSDGRLARTDKLPADGNDLGGVFEAV